MKKKTTVIQSRKIIGQLEMPTPRTKTVCEEDDVRAVHNLQQALQIWFKHRLIEGKPPARILSILNRYFAEPMVEGLAKSYRPKGA